MDQHHHRRGLGAAAAAAVAAALALTVIPTGPVAAQAEDEPLGERPYMGWSSFSMQVYTGDSQWIDAEQLKAQSDAMHDKLQEYGYEYINVDAGWNGGVDGHGRPVPSTALYPDGLQEVIDHVHDNGQKFGLYFIPGLSPQVYEDDLPIAGAPECSTADIAMQPLQQADYWDLGYRIDFANPCSQAYIDSIADLIASWGVDFVKFDSVTPGSGVSDLSLDARDDVAAWSQALEGHDIWLELSWALDIDYADYWAEHAQGWRVDWDVECYCPGEALTKWENIERLFPRVAEWWRHAGPDTGWNDLDSLNVGNGRMDGLTRDERRTAATLWAVSASPMYLGDDLTTLDEYGIELLTNPEVIAVNQAGVPARPVATATPRQTWYALNADGTYTVALFNTGATDADMTLDFADIGLDGSAKVRDLWAQEDLGKFDGEYTAANVPINGTRLFKVTPSKGAEVTVNDDSLRVAYEGDWNRNGGSEVAATSQALALAVGDSSTGEAPTAPEASYTVPVNDDSPEIAYTGSWGHSTGRGMGDHQDDVHYSESNGDAVEYAFVGTGVDYVTETHESQGEVDVYLDGEFQETVDTHQAEGRGVQQVVYSVADLPNGAHTIRLEKKSGQFMLLDRFDVRQETLIQPGSAAFDKAEPEDVAVTLLRDAGELEGIAHEGEALEAGTDYTVEGDVVTVHAAYLAGLPEGEGALDFRFRGDHLDDVHATAAVGDAVSFGFRGTAVTWTGPTGPDQGEVDIYIDGELVDRVDTASAARLTGRELFSATGLRDGEHTFRAVMVSGETMRADAFAYTVKSVS
ncbi:X2-like carbohydrate binding domain-containing protein [Glycomyces harbinensis]|uniref:Alpha-galactosidase n=1 Tax=Glycomyces harbinensis TaxID=58114 RepID=A0A1G7ACD2_9ACTN|nr:X2-like carbohydrate binding domain-containing protein [Glycomyces harbinensis]SDE12588.1 Carbohydrate binding domain X2 [Glycomyces harbinensis]